MATNEPLLAEALRHHQAGRLREAEAIYRRLLAADPGNPNALQLLGLVAHQLGQNQVAVKLIGEAIRRVGNVPAYHNNLGEAYRCLGRFPEAISSYRRAIALDQRFAQSHNNLGTVHQNQGSLDLALACYEKAIACQGDYVNAHYNRARAWLTAGDFIRGWKEYEWRWSRPEFTRQPLDQPEWDGTPLAGRTLLVRWEQGLGDTLQFIRYLNVLAGAGETVVATAQPALVPLLAQSGFHNVLPSNEPLPPFDVHAMLLSLPRLLGTTLETIPAQIPYITARPTLVEDWHQRLSSFDARCRIGIFWQGNRTHPSDHLRSFPLTEFEPLARVPGVRLISLQKGNGVEQLPLVADRFDVVELPDVDDRQFTDTAAIIASLDLVITTDSVVTHLAGAMGVPVWVALSTAVDFRWLQDRPDSPWYPTLRLFRQRHPGQWADVFEEISAALVERIGEKT